MPPASADSPTSRSRALIACALVAALAPSAGSAAPAQPGSLPHKGIGLGLFAEDPGYSYDPLLEEIAATGASHVSIVIPYYQHSLRSTRIAPHPRFSPRDAVVERTLRQAQKRGLKVLLFPILRLEYAVTPQEWRGSMRPKDPQAWWESYTAFILKFARLAARHQVAAFCVGSELGSLDTDPAPWATLTREVRRVYRGKLVYSANWDHFEQVRIWQLVDLAGLSAYFQLTAGRAPPTLQRLIHAWREQWVTISRWLVRTGKPLVFTELGYHSQQGTSAWPWDESADKPVDLKEQANCYRAFIRVWDKLPYLHGVYFWNWFGYGGPDSREYCPRGKPAAAVICRWYGSEHCPRAWGMPWDQALAPDKR